ncbi:MAG: carboxypeptidase-like regulatory domain-containing protein [Acidobacteriota bacterium]
MRSALCVTLLAARLLSAQTPAPAAAKPAANGQPAAPAKPTPQGTAIVTVVEKGSKRPIEQALVALLHTSGSQIQNLTNVDGVLQIKVQPGSYRITVRPQSQTGFIGSPAVSTTIVRVDEESKVTVEIPPSGEISGRILDARGEPLQGARVSLFIRNYEIWSSNIIYGNTPLSAQSNDLGEFLIQGVPAGIAFHLYSEVVAPNTVESAALAAADPDARRPILAGTFYPRTTDPTASAPITLSEGQHLDNVEVRMVQSKSYCLHSRVLPQPPGDMRYTVSIDPARFASVVFNGYGSFRTGRTAQLDKEGNAHVCGLWPGTYKVTVQSEQFRVPNPGNYAGFGEFIVTDRDITGLNLKAGPMFDLAGESHHRWRAARTGGHHQGDPRLRERHPHQYFDQRASRDSREVHLEECPLRSGAVPHEHAAGLLVREECDVRRRRPDP